MKEVVLISTMTLKYDSYGEIRTCTASKPIKADSDPSKPFEDVVKAYGVYVSNIDFDTLVRVDAGSKVLYIPASRILRIEFEVGEGI